MARLALPKLPSMIVPIPPIPSGVPTLLSSAPPARRAKRATARLGVTEPSGQFTNKSLVMPLAIAGQGQDDSFGDDYDDSFDEVVPKSEAIVNPAARGGTPFSTGTSILDVPILEGLSRLVSQTATRAREMLGAAQARLSGGESGALALGGGEPPYNALLLLGAALLAWNLLTSVVSFATTALLLAAVVLLLWRR